MLCKLWSLRDSIEMTLNTYCWLACLDEICS